MEIHIENDQFQLLCGQHDQFLRFIEKEVGLLVHVRGNCITLSGYPAKVHFTERLIRQLHELVLKGYPLILGDIKRAMTILDRNKEIRLVDIFLDTVFIPSSKRIISPKSLAQKQYIENMRHNDIVFGIGPAGTGKTYLAMAMAVNALMKKEISRIILARPAVEAGEHLGFLPGNILEKVNPYLRPLYDALHDMMDYEKVAALIDKGAIEVAPLAFMRGRTLNSSFVILDEAQNTTSEQMKMFLTRLGFDSKTVITGDITQIDLPSGIKSGLIEAKEILSDIPGLGFSFFTEIDIIRHPLVQKIVAAYGEKKNGLKPGSGK